MSSDALQQAMETRVKSLEEKTGKTIAEWIAIVQDSKLEKHGELVNMLKEKYGIGHGYANMVVHTAKQSHAGFSGDGDLVNAQYQGKENLRPWYDALVRAVSAFGKDVEVSPKKAYVRLRRKKQFAIIQPATLTRPDVGLNLKGVAPSGTLEAAGSWNAMCTHRIKIQEAAQADAEVVQWLKKAYDQAG